MLFILGFFAGLGTSNAVFIGVTAYMVWKETHK